MVWLPFVSFRKPIRLEGEGQIIQSFESCRKDLRIPYRRQDSPSFLSQELNDMMQNAASKLR